MYQSFPVFLKNVYVCVHPFNRFVSSSKLPVDLRVVIFIQVLLRLAFIKVMIS